MAPVQHIQQIGMLVKPRVRWRCVGGALRPVLQAVAMLGVWPTSAMTQGWLYTLRPGESLWAVASRYLSDTDLLPELQRSGMLGPGIRVRCGADSSALRFAEGSRLLLHGGSTLALGRISGLGDRLMVNADVRPGNGRIDVRTPSGSSVEVQTPAVPL
jgi:hypothetical protein